MDYQQTTSYDVETMDELERQCEAVASELCDEAVDARLLFPYAIEFRNERGTFASVTVTGDDEEWQWLDGPSEFEGDCVTAVFRSAPIRRSFQLTGASATRD